MKNLLSYKRFNESTDVATDVEVEYLPKSTRSQNREIVKEIAEAIHASDAQSEYTELHMPDFVRKMGSNFEDKRRGFYGMLMDQPRDLWAVKFEGKIVGFIVTHNPGDGKDRIGFGINSKFSGKGILLKAFNQIKNDLRYPLYGETSIKNKASQQLMRKMGFQIESDIMFAELPSYRFVKNQP